MPMIRGTDQHGVNNFVLKQFTIIPISSHSVITLSRLLAVILVHQPLGFFYSLAIEIADSHDLSVRISPDARQIMNARDATRPDGANIDPVAGPIALQDRRGHD